MSWPCVRKIRIFFYLLKILSHAWVYDVTVKLSLILRTINYKFVITNAFPLTIEHSKPKLFSLRIKAVKISFNKAPNRYIDNINDVKFHSFNKLFRTKLLRFYWDSFVFVFAFTYLRWVIGFSTPYNDI